LLDQLRGESLQWAEQISDGPPLAIRGILESVHKGLEVSLQEGTQIELDNLLKVRTSEDAIEGVTAFFTKRQAEFKGK